MPASVVRRRWQRDIVQSLQDVGTCAFARTRCGRRDHGGNLATVLLMQHLPAALLLLHREVFLRRQDAH